ncbi:MAG: AmmeMemoRadiSam system protein A [Oscillospiraceae bacterium]|nr:AmmeMemoRadiSam system protein A [Oscillospiraceae bacterium]
MNPYIKLTKYSIEHFVKTGRPADLPAGLPAELLEKEAGVFVSLKKHGVLRGCIGTILPTKPSVAEEILRNAISACSEDPRFPPIEENELDALEYSTDVLMPPEIINSLEMLDVKKYGVIVTSGYKRGLLLPNLDGVDTVEEQVAIAMRKAGITPDEIINLERFEVVRYK